MKIEIEKPIVPKFVAEWLESIPRYYNIIGALGMLDEDSAKDVFKWCMDVDHAKTYETITTAFLYGYEIEQDPLYYAKIKGHELVHTGYGTKYWILDCNKKLFIDELPDLGVDDIGEYAYIARLPIKEWNELGINEGNADFEKVEG